MSILHTMYSRTAAGGLLPPVLRGRWWLRLSTELPFVSYVLPSHHDHHLRSQWSSCSREFSTRNGNPYAVLGIPTSSSFEEVQSTFLRLALKHHPDKTGQADSVDDFVRMRQAFETIRATALGKDLDKEEAWSDEELQNWLHTETGEFLSFKMDYQTRQECIKAYATLAPGGRDPGEWEMARQLTERENRKDDNEDGPLKQLTGNMEVGALRRRRQRR